MPCKRHTAAALPTRCYSSRGAVVSVVSAVRVHFLTLVNNSYSIVKEHIRRVSFPLYPSHLKRRHGFVSVVSAVT